MVSVVAEFAVPIGRVGGQSADTMIDIIAAAIDILVGNISRTITTDRHHIKHST